jgi:8-oxo-dGTP diphosphatase
MRARKVTPVSAAPLFTVAVVLLSPVENKLGVLLQRTPAAGGARGRWSLPQRTQQAGEALEHSAQRVAHGVIHGSPSWLEQIGAFAGRAGRSAGSQLTIAYLGLVPAGIIIPPGGDTAWFSKDDLPAQLPALQREIVMAAVGMARGRMDQAPIAFRLLQPTFTLSELQAIYELLMGKNVHKASFRRALQAASLVEPIDEWRSEGRGRPAQLYRYAPRRRRNPRRSVRFDRLE